MAGTRFALAGAMLAVTARARGTAWPTRIEWRNAAVIGVLLLVGGNGFVAIAQKTVDSGVAAAFLR